METKMYLQELLDAMEANKHWQKLPPQWQKLRRDFALKEREMEVLYLVAVGCSYRKITYHLNLNEGAIRRHARNAFSKMGISTRKEFTQFVIKKKLPRERLP
jgi:DNA-binding NarL/FixJ family response regulator